MSGGCVVWFTGLPSSGKSTLAGRVRERLAAAGAPVALLDSDQVREALVPSPGYDPPSRDGFYTTLGRLAVLLAGQGLIVLVPATAHRRSWRDRARASAARFFEVYVDTDAVECRRRDPKGLYRAAPDLLPGVGVTYEPPLRPEVRANGGSDDSALAAILDLIAA